MKQLKKLGRVSNGENCAKTSQEEKRYEEARRSGLGIQSEIREAGKVS